VNFKKLMLACLAGLMVSPVTIALTFTVDIATDDANAHDVDPGNGICSNFSGSCTLRAALEEANTTAALDVIQFADGLAGLTVVIAASEGPLPTVINQVFILGETIAGYDNSATLLRNAPPQLTIDGSNLSSSSENGLLFFGEGASDSIVSALSIVNFPGDGITTTFGADRLTIHRNYIGVKPDRTSAANDGNGVRATSSNGHLIGRDRNAGATAFTGLGNVIQSNGQSGVRLEASNNNELRGNLIGISPSGTGDRGNGAYGIHVSGSGNVIGDRLNAASAGNFIGGNNQGGMLIVGNNNLVHANQLGKGETGGFISSEGNGIEVYGSGNFIGNTNNNGNKIYEHDGDGIQLGQQGGTAANSNFVIGNEVGSAGSQFPLLLSGNLIGIDINQGDTNIITDNVVLNSSSHGIYIRGTGNTLLRNRVGYVDSITGTPLDEPNLHGLYINGPNTIIGQEGSPNYIGGNTQDGIRLIGAGAQVHYNYIGVSSSNKPIGNGFFGIYNSNNNQSITNNVIGANGEVGLGLQDMEGGVVEDNLIGVAPDGSNLGNGSAGITLGNAAEEFEIKDNQIAFNNGSGISGGSFAMQGVAILRNSMHHNASIGIDLGSNGISPNDPGDADLGPNSLINFPVIEQAALNTLAVPATLTLSYRVDTLAENATYPLILRFYWTDIDELVQGRYFFFFDPGYNDPNKTVTTILNSLPPDMTGGWIMATTTDQAGNTSEFSAKVQFGTPPGELIFKNGFEN
jgi:parallel beta-helix repeat protein